MENTEIREFTPMPRIGDPAPEFKAVTTQGEIHFPNDYKGKWVILFSHPADFTPVCHIGIYHLCFHGMRSLIN